MEVVEVFGKYALASIVMALIVMIIIGVVKIFTKVLYKGESSDKRTKLLSKIYLLLALVLSGVVVEFYYLFFKIGFNFMSYCKDIALVYSCTQALYPIYRKYGGRTLFLKIISMFKGKNKDVDKVINIIEGIVMLTDEQKEALKEKL